jgi:Ran GTPase-activating protein (RanGAP) involved in mRNA processing and transport
MWKFVLPKNTEDVDLSGYEFDKEELDKISKKLNKNQVRSLNISNNSLKIKELKIFSKAFEKSKILDSLDLSENDLSIEGIELFSKILSSSSLVTLNLSGNSFGDEGIVLLTKYLKKNEMIKNLNISNCGFSEEGVKEISKLLSSEKCNLKRLDISGNHFDEIDSLFETLIENKKLKVLKLSEFQLVHDQSILEEVNIFKMLQKNYSLKQLNLIDSFVSSLDLGFFFSAMSANPTLEILNIKRKKNYYRYHHSEESVYVPEIIQGIEKFFQKTSLRVLNLNNFFLDFQMFEFIAKGLEINSSIEILNLEGNYLGKFNSGLESFKSLKKNETLKELYLNSNFLQPKELENLIQFLEENKTLEKLDISNNHLQFQNLSHYYLQKNTSMLVLKLDDCGIKSKDQTILLESLERNQTLVSLSMKCSKMDDFEMTEFPLMYESIKQNNHLEELKLFDESRHQTEVEILISKIMERNETCKSIQRVFKNSVQGKLNDIRFSHIYMAYKRPFEE